eukprot:gene18016-biopygen27591
MIHACVEGGARRPADYTDKRCKRGYPRDPCEYTTIDQRGYANYKRPKGSERVVPHNPYLLTRFQCHHNTEITATVNVVGYLYGYLSKGPDRVRSFISKRSGGPLGKGEDEILDYLTGRQVTCNECCWRLFGFGTNVRWPPIDPLNFTLEGDEPVVYTTGSSAKAASDATITALQRYFARPGSPSKPVPLHSLTGLVAVLRVHTMLYCIVHTSYIHVNFIGTFRNTLRSLSTSARAARELNESDDCDKIGCDWPCIRRTAPSDSLPGQPSPADHLPSVPDNIPGNKREYVFRRLKPHLFRIYMAVPSDGERFYLRMLLRRRPARSYTELRTVHTKDGKTYNAAGPAVVMPTFEAACRALGYCEDDDGSTHAMQEAYDLGYTPRRLLSLFMILYLNGAPPSRLLETATAPPESVAPTSPASQDFPPASLCSRPAQQPRISIFKL